MHTEACPSAEQIPRGRTVGKYEDKLSKSICRLQ